MKPGIMIVLIASIFALAACGGDDSSAEDMAAARDLTATADQSAAGLTCVQFIQCVSKCGADTTCQQACIASTSEAGFLLYNEVQVCSVKACTVAPDGGMPGCMSLQDQSAACFNCTKALGVRLGMGTTTTCKAELDACLAN